MITLITKERFNSIISSNIKFNIAEGVLPGYLDLKLIDGGATYFEYIKENENFPFAYIDLLKLFIIPETVDKDKACKLILEDKIDLSNWKIMYIHGITDEIRKKFAIDNFLQRLINDSEDTRNFIDISYYWDYRAEHPDCSNKEIWINSITMPSSFSEGTYIIENTITNEKFEVIAKLVDRYSTARVVFLFDDLLNYPVDIKAVSKKEIFIRNLFNNTILKDLKFI